MNAPNTAPKCPRCNRKWSVLHQNGDCECEGCKFKSLDNGMRIQLVVDDEWAIKWDMMLGQTVLSSRDGKEKFPLPWQPLTVDGKAILARVKNLALFW